MPIRHGGILASRASTWSRDHFCRSTMAPRASWPTTWNEFLPISMPGDRGIGCLRHGVLLVFGAPCQLRLLAGQEHGRTIPLADVAVNRFTRLGVPDRFAKLHQIGSTIASQAIVARCCSRTSHYTIVQRYTRERISYWLCRPVALELRRSQDGRNAVCLRRAEG